KLLQMTGEELEGLLRSIPAANISKIEVITAPPAKYDAQGNTGIINIVTKKSMSDGFNGSVSFTYQQRKRGSELYSGNFNYRHGKLNVFGNANINAFQFTSPQSITTYFETQKQEQELMQYNDPVFSMFQLGADYSLGERSTIGVQLFRGYTNKDMYQYYDINVVRLPQQILDSTIRTVAYNNEEGWRQTANLNYEWRIDTTGKKLNIDGDYFYRVNERGRNFETVNRYTDGDATGVRQDDRTEGLQDIAIRSVKADLTLPYKWATLSLGGKISSVKNTSNNLFLHHIGPGFIKDPNLSNEFKYTENTQAAYLSAQKTMGKWEAQAGLRYEQTQTEGISVTINQTNTNRYAKLFPSAYLTYTPNENNVFNINYSRRIDRPGFGGMNPFRQYFTPNSYEAGNPFLQPSFSNNMELGYTYKSKYTITLFANSIQAYATRVSQIDKASNAYNFTIANAGNSKSIGVTISGNFTPVKWWECNVEASGFINVFNSTYYQTGTVSYKSLGMYGQIGNTFTLNHAKTLFAELGYNYTSRQIDDFDIQLPNSNLSAGIKAMLMKKKLVVALTANDILKTDLWRMSNQFNGTQQNNYYDSRSIFASVTWKFGNSSVKAKRERSTGADESGRAN
ncbi:MAG: TonB-dependent receptor, partial [Sphingobacteriales bacterium]